MHITITFYKPISSMFVWGWLKTKFAKSQPAKIVSGSAMMVWKVSDEHDQEHVEDVIFEAFPLNWPITNIFISDRQGAEL